MRVQQFMSTDLSVAAEKDSIDHAAAVMHDRRIRHLPVQNESGQLTGVITLRDVVSALVGAGDYRETPTARAGDVMSPDPVFVRPDTPLLEAVRVMRRRMVGCLPVLGPDDELVGILTERDIMAVTADLLERSEDES